VIEDSGGISIVLVLSVLIIAALAAAVASFFVSGTEWLLFVSAGLVVLAFYVSRRTSKGLPGPDVEDSAPPARDHLIVTIEELGGSDSHHDRDGAGDDDTDPDDLDQSGRQPEAGRAIAS